MVELHESVPGARRGRGGKGVAPAAARAGAWPPRPCGRTSRVPPAACAARRGQEHSTQPSGPKQGLIRRAGQQLGSRQATHSAKTLGSSADLLRLRPEHHRRGGEVGTQRWAPPARPTAGPGQGWPPTAQRCPTQHRPDPPATRRGAPAWHRAPRAKPSRACLVGDALPLSEGGGPSRSTNASTAACACARCAANAGASSCSPDLRQARATAQEEREQTRCGVVERQSG